MGCGHGNAINLIDGLDGLAAGITAIAAGSFFLYSVRLDDVGVLAPGNVGPVIALCTVAACLGFLPYNFRPFAHHDGRQRCAVARVADGGRRRSPSEVRPTTSFSGSSFFFFAPLFIPLVILGVPILDTAFAIVRRAVVVRAWRRPTRNISTTG